MFKIFLKFYSRFAPFSHFKKQSRVDSHSSRLGSNVLRSYVKLIQISCKIWYKFCEKSVPHLGRGAMQPRFRSFRGKKDENTGGRNEKKKTKFYRYLKFTKKKIIHFVCFNLIQIMFNLSLSYISCPKFCKIPDTLRIESAESGNNERVINSEKRGTRSELFVHFYSMYIHNF